MNCASCIHFKSVDKPDDNVFGTTYEGAGRDHRQITAGGACHRHAPQPLAGGSGTGWADWSWPAVSPNDSCGEWRAKT
jgi:hypothetical protein